MVNMASMFNSFGDIGAGGGFPAPGIPSGNTSPTSQSAPTPDTVNPAAPSVGAGGPLAMDPSTMQQMLSMMGGVGGATPAPTDMRPPEERFQVQLQVSCVCLFIFSSWCSGSPDLLFSLPMFPTVVYRSFNRTY
jgi:ubiquilin